MLNDRYPIERLRARLVRFGEFQPYCTVDQRSTWNRLPLSLRETYRRSADQASAEEMPLLPASLFLADLAETDSSEARDRYETIYFRRRTRIERLVIAECIWNDGRYLMSILDNLWVLLEESYWGLPGHVFRQQAGRTLPDAMNPNVDLFSAETAGLVAWTYYLLGPRLAEISPVILPRIEHEVTHRILDPCLERDFHWMGIRQDPAKGRRPNNWTTWICSNWLSCILIVERDQDRRINAVHRVLRALDNFIEPYPPDGGCDEGPQYWDKAAGCLFDALESLELAVGGSGEVFQEPKIRNMGSYLRKVHIDKGYFVNFADANAVLEPDGPLAHAYGEAIEDADLRDLGTYFMHHRGLAEVGYALKIDREENLKRILRGLELVSRLDSLETEPTLVRDTWFPRLEVMTARDRAGSAMGLFLACKGGHNRESHNHNDIGTFIVYADGRPLIVDAGVQRYTGITFGPQRYSLWPMRSVYHSLLPTIDGFEQEHGFEFRSRDVAYNADDESATMTLDIAPSYPEEAGILHWRRTIHLERGVEVVVSDDFSLRNPPRDVSVSLLTPCAVDVSKPGMIRLHTREFTTGRQSAEGTVEYDGSLLVANVEELTIDDSRMGPVWGQILYRVVLTSESFGASGRLVYRVKGS